MVYEGAIGLADNLVASDGSVAIRICRDDFCKHLLKRFRKPIVSTSANVSGEKPPSNFPGISDEIKGGTDYIVNHRREETTPAVPSSVIKWANGQVIIIRE